MPVFIAVDSGGQCICTTFVWPVPLQRIRCSTVMPSNGYSSFVIFTTWECAAGGQFAVVQILCTASFVYEVWIIMDHGWSDCQQDNSNNRSTVNNLQSICKPFGSGLRNTRTVFRKHDTPSCQSLCTMQLLASCIRSCFATHWLDAMAFASAESLTTVWCVCENAQASVMHSQPSLCDCRHDL